LVEDSQLQPLEIKLDPGRGNRLYPYR
jgi:hypothetical protein